MPARLLVVPMVLDEANAYVTQHHRHHPRVVGAKFCLGVATPEGVVVGVSIVGRPVARPLDDGWTLEITRLCTDGTRNACSFLYAASWRACRALGYRKLGTYILASESGVSLLAAGWRLVGTVRGRSWHTPGRPRVDKHPTQDKIRWEAV